MNITQYLKDKISFMVGQAAVIVLTVSVLSTFRSSSDFTRMLITAIIIIDAVILTADYIKRRRYYKNINNTLEKMDKPQFIFPLIPAPYFYDAQELWEILSVTTKAMNDEIAMYKRKNTEYQEYIEKWIHEVKVPLSCISLMCDNNKSQITDSLRDEAAKIEGYVEQALYYARSTNLEKDYSIREVSLDTMVKSVLKKHSKQLIAVKASIEMDGLPRTVYTDPKWMEFILGQLLSNSIKYKNDKLNISFKAYEDEYSTILEITDNGIGIPVQDLGRVYEKGFTGLNGRSFAKSTGIGLYLCKQLCDKMCLDISISSVPQKGTTVKIFFPKDKFLMFE